jgi:hypothetical protein
VPSGGTKTGIGKPGVLVVIVIIGVLPSNSSMVGLNTSPVVVRVLTQTDKV